MLIVSLGLAVIGLAALVCAVVTSSEWIAWVCIGASVLGVVLLIVDALQERQRAGTGAAAHGSASPPDDHHADEAADYPVDADEEADGISAHQDSEPADDSVSDDR